MNTDKIKEHFPTFKKIYENIINNIYPKVILDYCFRILLFLILCRNCIMNRILEVLFLHWKILPLY